MAPDEEVIAMTKPMSSDDKLLFDSPMMKAPTALMNGARALLPTSVPRSPRGLLRPATSMGAGWQSTRNASGLALQVPSWDEEVGVRRSAGDGQHRGITVANTVELSLEEKVPRRPGGWRSVASDTDLSAMTKPMTADDKLLFGAVFGNDAAHGGVDNQ